MAMAGRRQTVVCVQWLRLLNALNDCWPDGTMALTITGRYQLRHAGIGWQLAWQAGATGRQRARRPFIIDEVPKSLKPVCKVPFVVTQGAEIP